MEGNVAVNVNLITADELVKVLEIDPALMAKVKAAQITIEIKLTAIVVATPTGESQQIPIKMSSLSELAAGKAAPILKQALQTSVTTALEKMLNTAKPAEAKAVPVEENPFSFGPAGQKPGSTAAKTAQAAAKPYQAFDDGQPAQANGKWKVLTAEQISQLSPVKLLQAEAMYQPVAGTSAGSKYFAVALKSDLKVAARIKGGALSVRVEGSGFTKYKQMLTDCEFSVHGDYASIHLDCNGSKLAARALGALICSMNVHFETPAPVLKMIGG